MSRVTINKEGEAKHLFRATDNKGGEAKQLFRDTDNKGGEAKQLFRDTDNKGGEPKHLFHVTVNKGGGAKQPSAQLKPDSCSVAIMELLLPCAVELLYQHIYQLKPKTASVA